MPAGHCRVLLTGSEATGKATTLGQHTNLIAGGFRKLPEASLISTDTYEVQLSGEAMRLAADLEGTSCSHKHPISHRVIL